jgi:predicted MFS family arabinose efflux permease
MNPAISHQLPKGAWLTVFLLFFVGTLNYLDRMMIATMRESIVSAIPMTDAQFGLLTSVFLWVYALCSPFAGFIADRFTKSRIIIGSLFVWSGVTWLTGQATTYNELLVSRALMGISEAFYIPAALSLIIDYHQGRTQSLATGMHMVGVMVGQSLGFIGGWIAEEYLWSHVFNVFGIIGILYSVFLIFTLKEPPADFVKSPAEKEKSSVRLLEAMMALFGKRSFVYLLCFWGMMGIVSWLVMAWLPTYYKEQFHLSQKMAGVYATLYMYLPSIIGLLLGGSLADQWSKTSPYSRISVPIIGLSVAAPCIFLASNSPILFMAVIFFMVYSLTRMPVDSNLMPVLCMVVDGRYRATGYGLMNMFATCIAGVGVYATGVLRDSQIDLRVIYQIASLSIIACIGLLFLVKRDVKKTKSIY